MAAASAPRRAADTWTRLTRTNPTVASIDALLRGTGQVMFQNNSLTGLLFLVGIFVNSAKLGGAGLLGRGAGAGGLSPAVRAGRRVALDRIPHDPTRHLRVDCRRRTPA